MRTLRKVEVKVAGIRYAIRTQADENYIRDLSDFVNQKIEEVKSLTKAATMDRLAVLAALNIADEFFRERCANLEIRSKIIERSENVLQELQAFLPKDREDEQVGQASHEEAKTQSAATRPGEQAADKMSESVESPSKALASSRMQQR